MSNGVLEGIVIIDQWLRQFKLIISVKMQFKKTFSSNLKNLSIKKTLILQPPPNDQYSLNSDIKSARQSNSPYQRHRQCSSALAQLSHSNKENCASYNYQQNNDNLCLSSSRRNSKEERQNMNPLLSFQKLKQGYMEVEDLQSPNMDEFTEANKNLSRRQIATVNPRLNYSNSTNTFGSMVSHQNKIIKTNGSGVRMGSMVYASLSKKDERKGNSRQGFEEGVRQSRSFDKLGRPKTQRRQLLDVECLNKDGRNAKYKVIKHEQDDEEMLYYCFNCAVPLVKQGFTVEELTNQDKHDIKIKIDSCQSNTSMNARNGEYSEKINYFGSNEKRGGRSKIGEQIKCRIILKLNKLKASKQQFNKKIENNLENIDYFYNSLIAHIEQQRLSDRQQVMRSKNSRKTQPQSYENQLNSCLGTVDYMMKHFQGINSDYIQDTEELLGRQIGYPQVQNSIQPKEGFQKKLSQFSIYFDRTLRINLEHKQIVPENSYKSRLRIPTQENVSRSNSLRFSFEEALEQSRLTKINKPNTFYEMNALQEENESELEDSTQMVDKRQDAFRNLFPEQGEELECSEYGGKEKHSPVFKEF